MCKEGELELLLTKAFNHFDQIDADEEMRISNSMRDLAGLWSQEALHECDSFELVGASHGMDPWPPSFSPKPKAVPNLQKRPWWAFWGK